MEFFSVKGLEYIHVVLYLGWANIAIQNILEVN